MNFIPYEKMNKKQRAAYDRQRRVAWGFSPTDRVKQSKKIYKREKVRYESI